MAGAGLVAELQRSPVDRADRGGLASAPDLAAAVARLHQAQGYQQQSHAALLPKLDAHVIAQETYAKDFPGGLLDNGWTGVGADALNLSFDLDLWGKNRAACAPPSWKARRHSWMWNRPA
jgi:outer membrane protein TolC